MNPTTRHRGGLRTAARLAAVLALAAGGLGVSAAAPAVATTQDCAGWPNPEGATDTWTVNTTQLPHNRTFLNRRVELRVGNINGVKYGWTRIGGYTLEDDQYWMDVTRDGGRSWVQCGPFKITAPGQTPWTPAYQADDNNPSLQFRACGRAFDGPSICGAWW